MIGPNYHEPATNVEKSWTNHQGVSGKSYGEAQIYWWKSFHDPVLTHLIEIAYQKSPTLQIAGVHILQERANLNYAIGNLLPQQQGVSGGSNYFYIPGIADSSSPIANLFGDTLGKRDPSIFTDHYLFSSSWELDFWGKYRRKIQSDKALFLKTVVSYDDALISLIGDVAENYILARIYEEEIIIIKTNIRLQKASLKIAETRFQSGEVSKLDVEEAQTELKQTEAELPKIENILTVVKNSLAYLLGLNPNQIDPLLQPGKIPKVPDNLSVGIPHDLLRQRPDVRAAGLDAASKSALIGVAQTALLPSFSLQGAFGASSSDIANENLINIFSWESMLVTAGSNFTMPILNYGRLVNKIRVADAVFEESLLKYQDTVLKAQKEVENGLSTYYQNKERMNTLCHAVSSATMATHLADVRYRQGQTDYTTVITAEQQQLDVEQSYVSSQGYAILGIVATYKALGGGWQMREGKNILSESVRQEMANRTNWGKLLKTKGQVPKIAPEERPVDDTVKGRPLWNLLNINKT